MNIESIHSRTPTLRDIGWNSFFQKNFQALQIPDTMPARVITELKDTFQVYTECGELTAAVSGRMRHFAETEERYPAVGDWVVIKRLNQTMPLQRLQSQHGIRLRRKSSNRRGRS